MEEVLLVGPLEQVVHTHNGPRGPIHEKGEGYGETLGFPPVTWETLFERNKREGDKRDPAWRQETGSVNGSNTLHALSLKPCDFA